ncbi:hypothetical protein V492_05016 [Pseudogymnoascus sp. VKM F-4246]|nr:hypothetical protein V492_05016 [Pseudogymnoascus sp. VKM F-4246]KFY35439.1 hypothetical protein V494_05895 [Pseudogymnoascus sp. VKM F-4513 (FW-928)]
MKITAIITVAALAMAPSASAWRVYFYQLQNGEGPSITNSGPGGTGSRCHPTVDPLNDKISSMRYYSDNAEGTTRCCIDLYRGTNCRSLIGSTSGTCRNRFVNFDEIDEDNVVSSYKTTCYAI